MRFFSKIRTFVKSIWIKLSPTAHQLIKIQERLDEVIESIENTNAQGKLAVKSTAQMIDEELRAGFRDVARRNELLQRADIVEIIQQRGLLSRSEMMNILRQSDLLHKTEMMEILQKSGLLHRTEIIDILQQSDLLHKTEMMEILQQSDLLQRSEVAEIFQQSGLLNRTEMLEILQQSGIIQKSDITDIVRQSANIPQIAIEYVWSHERDLDSTQFNTELYNTYKWLETQPLPPFIVSRFVHNTAERELQKLADKYHDKHIYILTDIPDYDFPYQVITLDQVLVYAQNEDALFILLYRFDWNALVTVRYFDEHGLKYQAPPQSMPMARYFHTNQIACETLMDEQSNNPRIHYCPIDFENIFQCLEATKGLQGDYVEIGTYQGASARAALNYMRRANIHRTAYFLDTYEGFTYEAAEKSSDSAWYGTHTKTSLEMVKEYLSEYPNAKPIKANIITDGLPDEITQIALCNIDVDISDAVYAALKAVAPLIVEHGIIIAEDYGHTPWLIGAQYAVRRFLEETNGFMPLYFSSGQMILIRL